MEGECPHYEDDFWRRADSAASGWTRIHETRTGPTDSIMRDFTYRTRRPLPAVTGHCRTCGTELFGVAFCTRGMVRFCSHQCAFPEEAQPTAIAPTVAPPVQPIGQGSETPETDAAWDKAKQTWFTSDNPNRVSAQEWCAVAGELKAFARDFERQLIAARTALATVTAERDALKGTK